MIAKSTPEKAGHHRLGRVCAALAERWIYRHQCLVRQDRIKTNIGQLLADKGRLSAEIIQSCVVSGDPVGEKFQFELLERYLETFENVEEIDPMGVDVELLKS